MQEKRFILIHFAPIEFYAMIFFFQIFCVIFYSMSNTSQFMLAQMCKWVIKLRINQSSHLFSSCIPVSNTKIWHMRTECINDLVQDCSNSSALAMELLQFCPKPSV